MSVGWLSVVLFPLLTSFFGFGLLAMLEKDRRVALAAVLSLATALALVALTVVAGPAELRAAIVWF
jgi:hypothetical protein